MKLPIIDRLWHMRGSVELLGGDMESHDAFARLDPLFQQPGTEYRVEGDRLDFTKRAPLAQDKMSVFRRGSLRVEHGEAGTGGRLVYDLYSDALFLCFLAPFFFLGIAWLIKDSRTSACVFAGIFAVLFVAGRILESRLIRNLLRRRLAGAQAQHQGDIPQDDAIEMPTAAE